jgi:hypothetical protein
MVRLARTPAMPTQVQSKQIAETLRKESRP